MESCCNQKSDKQIKIYFIFEILQSDALMTALHTLEILPSSFTWNAFPTFLKEIPYAEHLAAFPSLCGLTHPKPSKLGGHLGSVEGRASDAALHHSPSW